MCVHIVAYNCGALYSTVLMLFHLVLLNDQMLAGGEKVQYVIVQPLLLCVSIFMLHSVLVW